MEELVSKREVTLLESPAAARTDHELWVDQEFKVHYDSQALVDGKLREISEKHIEEARSLIHDGQFSKATKALRIALSADDRWVDPYLLEAVIAHRTGDATGISIARTAAARAISPTRFDQLLQAELG